MRRGALVLAALVSLILVAGSLPAAAYVNVGYDPDDADIYDIRSTVRRVERGEHGRFLSLKVRTYDGSFAVDSYLHIDTRLDARGGRAADAVLSMWILDMSGSGCQLETRSGRVLKKGSFRSNSHMVACRVPLHPLHPTKEIRWKVTTGSAPAYIDVAPDVGMYG